MVTEPMEGKLASSQFDLGHTNLFCIPEVTLVFFSSCDMVLGDSLQFHQGNRGSLRFYIGNMELLSMKCRESGLILQRGGSLLSFLELRQAPGVYSRVTAGMAI